jgi:hypothetical protein
MPQDKDKLEQGDVEEGLTLAGLWIAMVSSSIWVADEILKWLGMYGQPPRK